MASLFVCYLLVQSIQLSLNSCKLINREEEVANLRLHVFTPSTFHCDVNSPFTTHLMLSTSLQDISNRSNSC